MLFSEIGPNTLNRELNRYLEGTRLSLSQVAKRLGVSKGHLSEIKNGKAQPALNTGLRILKLCGLETEQRRAWAHFYNTSISEEYLEVHDDWEKENERKLSEKTSFMLARDLDLMNAYVDIVGEEDHGMALVDLRLEYGRAIEDKLEKLVEQKVVEIEVTDLGKIYKTGKVDPIITRNSSYDLLKEVVDHQQLRYQTGDSQGKFKFHINDINEEGVQRLTELMEKTMKEAETIMADHKKTRKSGGERYIFELLVGKLRSFIILIFGFGLFFYPQMDAHAQNGGLSGGSSRIYEEFLKDSSWYDLKERQDILINWPEVYMNGHYVKVNNLCMDDHQGTLQTIKPVDACLQSKIEYKTCWIVPGLGEEKCVDYQNSGNVIIPENAHSVMYRGCLHSEMKEFKIKIKDNNGIYVKFNSLKDERRYNPSNFDFKELDESGYLTLMVEINHVDPDKEIPPYRTSPKLLEYVGEKDYQVPFCL